jgi:hypothetical protein
MGVDQKERSYLMSENLGRKTWRVSRCRIYNEDRDLSVPIDPFTVEVNEVHADPFDPQCECVMTAIGVHLRAKGFVFDTFDYSAGVIEQLVGHRNEEEGI